MKKSSVQQIVILLVVCGLLTAGLTAWFQRGYESPELLLTEESEAIELDGPLTAETIERQNYDNTTNITNTMNPKAIVSTNYGTIEIELYEDIMPITAGNFIKLAEEGFYNGTKFHRVIDGFMIQGGDPNTKTDNTASYGTGGPGYAIADEHIASEKLTNVRGTISMANSGPNSGGSQFFINTVDNVNLDFDKEPLTSKHPVFGHVVAGMDVVDTISGVETGPRNLPAEPVIVESVVIQREG